MIKIIQNTPVIVFVIIATVLEATGDAIIRKSIWDHTGSARAVMMFCGALLVFSYGFTLNLAPVEFREVVGLYIASLFIVWQIVNFIAFRTLPTVPVLCGGALIIAGGIVITYWKPH